MVHKRASSAGGAFLHRDQWKKEDGNQQSSITVRMAIVAESTISALLAQWNECGLYELTKYYRNRLEQAIEEGVKTLRCMSSKEGHFHAEEHEEVTELKKNRTESITLFLSLMMGEGSQTGRAMWESFVKMRTELQKLNKILKELQELGPDPQEDINISQGLSQVPTQLIEQQNLITPGQAGRGGVPETSTSGKDTVQTLLQLSSLICHSIILGIPSGDSVREGDMGTKSSSQSTEAEIDVLCDGHCGRDRIDFADSRRGTESKHLCPDPEWWCEVSDIVYSLIQGKLLPGCSVLVTTRPTALHLLENAQIGIQAEILGFSDEERKKYFIRHFEDQTVAEAVFKHVKENEILYTMSYNPSYCWILALALGPFFTQRVRDPQRVPKTITQLYSYYIYNILKNHGREIENPRDVLLRVGQMAFRGVSEKKIVFTDGDLINYNLQPSQFLSGFLMELLEREYSARSVVYTFPHLTIQEFVAAVAQFLNPHPGNILKFLTGAHNTTDGRFEVFLRFVAGLSNPMTARGLEEFLGPFPNETTCRVIDWVKEEVKRRSGNTWSEAGKRSLLNTLHYLFESQNRPLAQATLGSVETLSFSEMTLTPIDCAVLSHAIGLCDTIKHLDLGNCHIQYEGIQWLGPGLHKCQELRLGRNELGDSGVKLVSAALRNPECKIQKLW
ncbi:NACHT, LRR and PYD domains-containing protein 3-like [Hemitrygon akajei]|uniref:NACHT, LRR and PYD domains-containing protein 3-like n=1 Tax=Hemitrygon akajei TaxID=2704970 RepID=UPI003BF94BDD